VLLAVEDDGPGVPASLRDGLFAPFVQGPQSRSHPSPGTGIGLSLVSKFAELHGGRAWLEESSTGGARFVVLLAGGRAPSSTVAQSEPSAG
jgi:signal transduction histidine kinase